jgi:alpha-L-arabinofuranosidase
MSRGFSQIIKTLTGQDGCYASSTIDSKAGKLYVKLVNSTDKPVTVTLSLGTLPYAKTAVKETLKSPGRDDYNSISNPKLIYPVSTTVKVERRKINAEAEPLSVNVFIIDFKVR